MEGAAGFHGDRRDSDGEWSLLKRRMSFSAHADDDEGGKRPRLSVNGAEERRIAAVRESERFVEDGSGALVLVDDDVEVQELEHGARGARRGGVGLPRDPAWEAAMIDYQVTSMRRLQRGADFRSLGERIGAALTGRTGLGRHHRSPASLCSPVTGQVRPPLRSPPHAHPTHTSPSVAHLPGLLALAPPSPPRPPGGRIGDTRGPDAAGCGPSGGARQCGACPAGDQRPPAGHVSKEALAGAGGHPSVAV
jgi:hypothetical protein